MLKGIRILLDINEDRILDWLKKLKTGAQTRNHYLQAVKQFVFWAIKKRRLKDDPLIGLSAENVKVDRSRKIRRALSPTEVSQVLFATSHSTKVIRRLTGIDRAMLYLVAATTGLRSAELASLTVQDFILEGSHPVIVVHAENEKAGRGVEQPVPVSIVPELKRYLTGKAGKVWGSSWPEKAWFMVQQDLLAAGIAQQTQEGYFDFHAWRHTYISILAQTTLTPKMVQDLSRHSDMRLTMSFYAHTQREQRSIAVTEKFPLLFPLQPVNSRDLLIQCDTVNMQNKPENAILPTGFEPVTYGLGNQSRRSRKAIKQGVCSHCKTIPLAIPLDLLSIINAWYRLAAEIKREMLRLAA